MIFHGIYPCHPLFSSHCVGDSMDSQSAHGQPIDRANQNAPFNYLITHSRVTDQSERAISQTGHAPGAGDEIVGVCFDGPYSCLYTTEVIKN